MSRFAKIVKEPEKGQQISFCVS